MHQSCNVIGPSEGNEQRARSPKSKYFIHMYNNMQALSSRLGYLGHLPMPRKITYPSSVRVNISDGALLCAADDLSGTVACKGIPHSKPPTRWRSPEPPVAWGSAILNASQNGNCCTDYEDCLYLSVYALRKHLPTQSSPKQALIPVMLHIHGGDYIGGCGDQDGTRLVVASARLGSPVIVVDGNYRLGPFGFMGSNRLRDPRTSSTGNWGIEDQRMMMTWVRRNIHGFGGDPTRVTLFGESAGAASIGVHLVQPASAPLFTRAIMMSGAFARWSAMPLASCELGMDHFAKELGCDHLGDASSVLQCMREMPFWSWQLAWSPTIYFAQNWSPCVDGVSMHDEPIFALAEDLAEDHGEAVAATAAARTNRSFSLQSASQPRAHPRASTPHGVLLGYTTDEMLPAAADPRNDVLGLFNLLPRNISFSEFEAYARARFWHASVEDAHANRSLGDAMVAAYGPMARGPGKYGTGNDTGPWWASRSLFNDPGYTCASSFGARQLAALRGSHVFLYRFDDVCTRAEGCTDPFAGVPHVGLYQHVWALTDGMSPADRWLSDQLVKYWTTFAHSGSPNGGRAQDETVWPRVPQGVQAPLPGLRLTKAGIAREDDYGKARCTAIDLALRVRHPL